jgi:hypothetical protein
MRSLTFCFGVGALFTHEPDAVPNHEWRVLPLVRMFPHGFLIEQSGGSIGACRLEVPGVVVPGLFRDPAGNLMGSVEMDGDTPLIP